MAVRLDDDFANVDLVNRDLYASAHSEFFCPRSGNRRHTLAASAEGLGRGYITLAA